MVAAAVGGLLAGPGSAAASGRLASSPEVAAEEYDVATPGFARERGISLAEAEQRLTWQSLAPDLLERLEPVLGERFGGVWVDRAGGDRIKVGVTGRVDDATVAQVRGTADAVGLTEGYDVVAVPRSLPELDRSNTWLGDEIARVNAGATAPLAAGLRPDLNQLVLHLPAGDGLTPAQSALVDTARSRLGAALATDIEGRAYEQFACTFPYCDPTAAGRCEDQPSEHPVHRRLASPAKSKVDDKYYLMMAGHCAYLNDSDWSSKDSALTSHVVGPVWHWELHAYADAAILLINNPGWGGTRRAGWWSTPASRPPPMSCTTSRPTS